jgi:hypothetical protein
LNRWSMQTDQLKSQWSQDCSCLENHCVVWTSFSSSCRQRHFRAVACVHPCFPGAACILRLTHQGQGPIDADSALYVERACPRLFRLNKSCAKYFSSPKAREAPCSTPVAIVCANACVVAMTGYCSLLMSVLFQSSPLLRAS